MRTALPYLWLLAAAPLLAEPIVLSDFEQRTDLHPAGNVEVRHVTDGAKVGQGCEEITFGVDKGQRFALVQGPNLPDLHQQLAQHPDLNGVRFWLQGDGSQSKLVFRIQIRNRENLKDIKGGFLYSNLSVRSKEWQLVEIPFAALDGPAGAPGMPREAWETYIPQIQFTAAADQRLTIRIDQLELAQVDPTVQREKPVNDGRNLLDQILQESAAQPVEPTGEVTDSLRHGLRLNGLWQRRPCPLDDPTSGAWETMRVPSMLPARRPDRAMWAVRRFTAPQRFADGRCRLRFGAVRMYAEVWLNGQRLGDHGGAFTPFEFDASAAVRPGQDNTLVVYVVDTTYAIRGSRAVLACSSNPLFRPNPPETDRMGLWQDVELLNVPAIRVQDVFVQTSVRQQRLTATVELVNETDRPTEVQVSAVARPATVPETVAKPFAGPTVTLPPDQVTKVDLSDAWPEAQLWSPEHPNLYYLDTTVTAAGRALHTQRVRFGFREFRSDGGRFLLNEVPIRLRGDSNLPAHNWLAEMWRPDFMRALFQTWKDAYGVNACRVHAAIGAPATFEAADEVGLLLIDQSSIWSNGASWYARGGQEFLTNEQRTFGEWIRRDRNHPSVVIWDAENEMVRGNPDHWSWVQKLDGFITAHDATRPVEHSGAGWCLGHAEIYHIHHNEHYTALWEAWANRRDKPMIAGEWWVGGRSGEQRLMGGEEFESYDEWVAHYLVYWRERTAEQRSFGLSGIMPFVFTPKGFGNLYDGRPPELTWEDPTAPAAQPARAPGWLNPGWVKDVPVVKPVEQRTKVFRDGLGPLFVCVKEKTRAVAAAQPFVRTLTIANDSEERRELTARWQLVRGDQVLDRGEATATLQPGELAFPELRTNAPAVTEPTAISLEATLYDGAQRVSGETQPLTVYPTPAPVKTTARLALYDPVGATTRALTGLGVQARAVEWPPPLDQFEALLLGAGAFDDVPDDAAELLERFVAGGGRVLSFRQEHEVDWTPVPFGWDSSVTALQPAWQGFGLPEQWRGLNYTRQARILMPEHPVFKGLQHGLLQWWANGDGRVADDLLLKPNLRATSFRANLRPLVAGTRREQLGLVEVPHGQGFYVLCQLRLEPNAADPEARTLLRNLVQRVADGAPPPRAKVAVLGEQLGTLLTAELGAEVTVLPIDQSVPPGFAAVLCGADVPDSRLSRIEAPTVFLTARPSVPPMFRETVKWAGDQSDADYISCARATGLFAGLNCFDFQRWDHPVTVGRLELSGEESAVRLSAHVLPESFQGGGVGLKPNLMRPRGPAVVETLVGGRRYVLCQLDLSQPDARTQYVWNVLLTNLGVPLRSESLARRATFQVLPAPELKLDGNLEEWTCDIEDRNVTSWVHAEPVPLRGVGVVYLLWQPDRLLVAAGLAVREPATLELQLGDRTLRLTVNPDGTVTGPPGVKLGSRLAPADSLPDLRLAGALSGQVVALEAAWPLPAGVRLTTGATLPWRVDLAGAAWPRSSAAGDPATWAVATLAAGG